MSIEIFRSKTHIDFVGMRWAWFTISGLLVGGSILLMALRGLNYAIDFTGGAMIQLAYETPQSMESMRSDLAKAGFGDAAVQQFMSTKAPTFSVRLKAQQEQSAAVVDQFVNALQAADAAKKFKVERKEYVGPTVGKHLKRQAILAIVLSLLGIVVYVAFRFSNVIWGIAGIIALAHDVMSLFGFYALFRMEFDLVLVAAVLTIAGFSINDTIVIFDRMREKMRAQRGEAPLREVINESINETLSRTIITSFTVIMTVMALTFLGGRVLFDFSSSMLFGLIIGSYSTIAIAAPIVYQWEMGGWKEKASSAIPGAAKPAQAPQPRVATDPASGQAQPEPQAGAAPAANDRRSRRERRRNR